VAEGQILYDALGNAVGKFAGDEPGMFLMDTPAAPAPAPVRPPATAPVQSYQGPQNAAATTQHVQGQAEYVQAGEVQGEDTYVPFGPAIVLPEEYLEHPVDLGYRWDWFDGTPRRTFRIAPSIGLMPLLRFAHAAKAGLDTEDMEGMAALYDMIADCVHPDDWSAFMAYATESKAQDEELMEFVGTAMEIISARPRPPRGSSSATSRRTLQRSKGSSSQPGMVIPDGATKPSEFEGLMPVGDLVN
jgi:hypothetical protein